VEAENMGKSSSGHPPAEIALTRVPPPSWDPGRGLIERPGLIERLGAWSRCSMILLAAPAGYGKTTLLAEWDASDPRPFAWVTIDSRDNDPSYLARSLAAALDRIEPMDPTVFDLLAAPGRGISSTLIPRFAVAVAGRSEPCVLILDDFHLVDDPESLDLVAALAAALPEGSQVAIGSRHSTGLRLGRLRADGLLAEAGPDKLAMSRKEIAAVLALSGIELDPEPLAELAEHTEGWPVAVYLASRGLRDEPAPAEAIRRFTGDDRMLADYLREELIALGDEDDLALLTACSVLDQLNGDVCDALLDREGSAADLRRISRENLLLMPLDRSDREFRYHALFREMLLGELESEGGKRKADLHLRASRFYAEHGDFDRAIAHAVESGDVDSAGELLWLCAPGYASHGRTATVFAWLDSFDDARIAATPTLALTKATVCLTTGDGPEIDRLTTAALSRIAGELSPDAVALTIGARLIKATGSPRGGLDEGLIAAERAQQLLPDSSPWRSLACLIAGSAHLLKGDPEEARPLLEEGASRGAQGVPTIRAISLAQLLLLALDAGDETAAWEYEEQAAAVVERYALDELPTQALVAAASALVRARRGRVADAVVGVRRATALIASLAGLAPWYDAESRIVLARAMLQVDDLAGAQSQLDDAERFVRACADAPVLAERHASARAAAEAPGGSGRWPLTPAELRLLHLLPTHLSLREIADQLYVSNNTVKSQARSIYRKLSVTSRGEAVSAARAGGLLAGDEHAEQVLAPASIPVPPS
jgi:LuxR family maltose regulon positive regulatory protein